ncbi:uncharacterized protein LOC110656151 isoform X2 [Hevea brasiliensis]|uniref:uncharacterized protein LOC110656151 isoform X2 n=1 Tax=Hevea brasiliensis TaxID=3981 RepID=UPI000B76F455|nr:uncharacterized protein LOC110656151 isoform X2 [Hevea brasiliensis]
MEKKRSWTCTLIVQVSLCIAFYLSLNLGQHQNSIYHTRDGTANTRPLDVYFLSVGGGFRPLNQQIHLLKLMENVAKAYKAKFVVNISELGEDDPLTQNASRLFSSMNIPWYTTRASKGWKVGCFMEQINLTHGKMLTIAGVDTESLQDSMLEGSMNSFGNNQLNWLTQTLEANPNSWLIVVGYHPMVVCEDNEEQTEEKKVYEPLHRIFMTYGVNAYLSRQGCINHDFEDDVDYIGITNPIKSEFYMDSLNGSSVFQKEMNNGFLLHRVSSLEILFQFNSCKFKLIMFHT